MRPSAFIILPSSIQNTCLWALDLYCHIPLFELRNDNSADSISRDHDVTKSHADLAWQKQNPVSHEQVWKK